LSLKGISVRFTLLLTALAVFSLLGDLRKTTILGPFDLT